MRKLFLPWRWQPLGIFKRCIELLNNPKTDVNARQQDNLTPLYAAAQEGYNELVDILLNKGADPTICLTSTNSSPLNVAVGEGHNSVIESLINFMPFLVNLEQAFLRPYQSSPLHLAAYKGSCDAVELLLKKGALINAVSTDIGKMTPLYYAAQNGHADVVEKLIASGADYIHVGTVDPDGELVPPLEMAGRQGHIEVVKCLLRHPHSDDRLKQALFSSMAKSLRSTKNDKRQRCFTISGLIQEQKEKQCSDMVLTLNDEAPLSPSSFISAFEYLFSQKPDANDTNPSTKDAAIRYALAAMYNLLSTPSACIPYLRQISEELECQWIKEQNAQPFPVFDEKWVTLHAHNGMLWPIPNNDVPQMKRFNILDRILLAKFHQYNMGEQQLKWTGFIPKNFSRKQLLGNVFFVENYRTIDGLFHGNMHNLQRVIGLLAMESGLIPLTYQENGQEYKVAPKDIFSALMRRDIMPSGKTHGPLWLVMFDSGSGDALNFNFPHQLHFTLLTNSKLSGALQDYLRFSFCSHYNHMRDLYNHVYESCYDNQSLWQEVISKLYLHLFSGKPEFAIQMEEKKNLSDVGIMDEERDSYRKWHSRTKTYSPLTFPIRMTGSHGFFSQPDSSGSNHSEAVVHVVNSF